MKIYVDLPDELVAVWCPVEAIHIQGDVYQIVEVNRDPEDTRWPFATGARVKCKPTFDRGDAHETILVAYAGDFKLTHYRSLGENAAGSVGWKGY
jgi:hypothetical protein